MSARDMDCAGGDPLTLADDVDALSDARDEVRDEGGLVFLFAHDMRTVGDAVAANCCCLFSAADFTHPRVGGAGAR